MSFNDELLEKTRAESSFPETKAEIIQHYQQEYGARGKTGWKQSLVRDLLPFTKQTGKNPAKNLEKRFDTQRRNNPEPRNKEQYKALGKTLTPRTPDKGYRVTFKGYVRFSGLCVPRQFTVVIVGIHAEELVRTGDADIILSAWFNYRADKEVEGICEEYPYTLVVEKA